jgi:hypothetical protein
MTWHVTGDPYFRKLDAVHVKHNLLHENQENPILFNCFWYPTWSLVCTNKRNRMVETKL